MKLFLVIALFLFGCENENVTTPQDAAATALYYAAELDLPSSKI